MRIFNRKARFNYQLLETFEAGIVLSGEEVKAVKAGKVNLTHAYAKVINNEIYLVGAVIDSDSATPSQKLLLHKREINAIKAKIKAKSLTLVPTKIYTKKRLIKVEIALAKSKRKHGKKETKKLRDIERDLEAELRGRKVKNL